MNDSFSRIENKISTNTKIIMPPLEPVKNKVVDKKVITDDINILLSNFFSLKSKGIVKIIESDKKDAYVFGY